LEKVVGEVTTSDIQKKTGFWDSLNNHLNYGEGNVNLNGHRVDYDRVWEEGQGGSTLKVGDEIKTGNGRVVLKFADGTRFILMENTYLRKTADGFIIERGVVASTFWKTGNKVRLITKHGNFMVKGTKFAIATGEENTVIEVYEGVVATEANGQTKDVTQNGSLSITDGSMLPEEMTDSQERLNLWNDISNDIEKNYNDIATTNGMFWVVLIVIVLIVVVLAIIFLLVILILIFRMWKR
jgi:hypothetical protein